MSSEANVLPSMPVNLTADRLRTFRLIPRIETYPRVVSLAQTTAGKLALLTCFGLILWRVDTWYWLMLACLAATTFLPQKRHLVVMLATMSYTVATYLFGTTQPLVRLSFIGGVFALGALLIWISARRPQSLVGKNALTVLFAAFTGLILLCCWLPSKGVRTTMLWEFTMVLGSYFWFIGYALLDHKAKSSKSLTLHLGSLRPFWGSTATPFPSGPASLRRVEAKDAESLAVIQLKGLKLLVWAMLLSFFLSRFTWFFHDYLHIPHFQTALYLSTKRTPVSWQLSWASIIIYYFYKLISISVWGHQIIACCRMAGFDAMRNTYRPLSSTSVAEYFNRYYFYYKELLVYFFFFPTFLKMPTRWGRLRVPLAIFAAVTFGNTFYHFTRDLGYIQANGLWNSIASYDTFFFYSIVLAAGIAISRTGDILDPSLGFVRNTLLPATLVGLFNCLLNIFSQTDRAYPLTEYLRFLGHLFFLN
jgi:hypothetical protein